jgi:hypothetical protein
VTLVIPSATTIMQTPTTNLLPGSGGSESIAESGATSGLKPGAIGGIVGGIFGGFLIFGALMFLYIRRALRFNEPRLAENPMVSVGRENFERRPQAGEQWSNMQNQTVAEAPEILGGRVEGKY